MRQIIAVAFVAALCSPCAAVPQTTEPKVGKQLDANLERARSPGYRMLLRQLHEPDDRGQFGEFFDHGALAIDRYKAHRDLPPGYWVYVHPYWYVWRDRLPPNADRSYGPEQAAGPPNVTAAGDSVRAWCPKLMDTEREWLLAEFSKPTKGTAVLVHENYNPGSIERVTLFTLDGREIDAWRAEKVGNAKGKIRMQRIPLPIGFLVSRPMDQLAPVCWAPRAATDGQRTARRAHEAC